MSRNNREKEKQAKRKKKRQRRQLREAQRPHMVARPPFRSSKSSSIGELGLLPSVAAVMALSARLNLEGGNKQHHPTEDEAS
jgi:hypothetical protein